MSKLTKQQQRVRRHSRVRARVKGSADRPRVAVFRSSKQVHLQAIDDDAGKTLFAAHGKDAAAAAKDLAIRAQAAGVKTAVFDRGGFLYHGRVKKIAEVLREQGIKI